jgi:hypothetical protein
MCQTPDFKLQNKYMLDSMSWNNHGTLVSTLPVFGPAVVDLIFQGSEMLANPTVCMRLAVVFRQFDGLGSESGIVTSQSLRF